MTQTNEQTKFGFIGIMGPTNAGKSTFLNQILKQKLSIVSPKVQTTRTRVLGILHRNNAQMAFFDTPGLFKPKRYLDESMVKTAWQSLDDVDITLFFLDASAKIDLKSDIMQKCFAAFKSSKKPVALVLNKIDLVDKKILLELTEALNEAYNFDKSFMVSAEKNFGVEDILDWLQDKIPEGPFMYDPDQLTDLPSKIYAAEVTREKLFLYLHQELPYAINVQTESWEEREDGSIRIEQVIYVKKPNHKGIVLGKGGQGVKRIGQKAREEISAFLGKKIHLFLFVKVKENWDQDRILLEECGF
jgi:GTP-binding protein Era